MANTNIPDAEIKIGRRDKDVPWYVEKVGPKLGDAARELLQSYSKVPANEVEDHIYKIRDEAWNVWPYPCIGGFRFLELAIGRSPYYSTILQRLKTGNENFLDLGCCFGQELRKLAADGAPSEHLYGSDLRPEFFDLGYKLWRDKDTLKSQFIAADVFDPESGLKVLDGKIDIIYIGAFLHLFDYKGQVEVCKRIVKLSRNKKGSVVLGRQVGNLVAGQQSHRTNPDNKMYRHTAESFQKMWDEVGEFTGTKWRTEAELLQDEEDDKEAKGSGWVDPSMRRLRFHVFRE